MAKLLSIIALILSLLLFPPASLALISNNAVPGDATYPIKRALENGIYAIVALHPTTKAWFSAARSERRFKEFSTLIAQGKSASDTLDELVSQTDIAANELAKIEDPVRKQQLADQLLDSIKKYDQGLEQVSNQLQPTSPQSAVQVTPKPTPAVTTTPAQPKPSVIPQPKPSPTPASTPVSTPRPTPSIQPATPPQPPQGGSDAKDIEDARKKIEETKKKIEEERKKLKKEHFDKKEQGEVKSKRDKEDKNDDDSERKERRDRKKDE